MMVDENVMISPVTLPPGFRFHPTDEELVSYYLKRKINRRPVDLDIIPEVDLYKCEPWELPGKSLLPSKDLEWYFFSPRDRKYPNGSRTNRATKAGYWKATGKDRKVTTQTRSVGMKKTLVYYRGRAPHGSRTGWVMHEYRLDDRECEAPASGLQDAYALCRIFKKSTAIGPKIDRVHSDYSSSSNYRTPCDTRYNNFSSSEDALFHHPPFPSKVDCARMQHQYLLPPLEVQEFPQAAAAATGVGSSCYNVDISETDCFQQFLYQELNNPLDGYYGGYEANFSTPGFSSSTCIEIEEPKNEEIVHVEKMPENLRWVGMSYKDLEKSFFEECKNVPVQNNLQCSTTTGEIGQFELDEFAVDEFITDHDNLLEDETFQIVEEVQVYHGMFVSSTRQIAQTFFHQIVPSNTVSVHLNPATHDFFPVTKVGNHVTKDGAILIKMKASLADKLRVSRILNSRVWPFLTVLLTVCYIKLELNK